jgi:hypothetical protein
VLLKAGPYEEEQATDFGQFNYEGSYSIPIVSGIKAAMT